MVSVIIPVYNVEKFVGKCTESLMRQTLDDVEFIFVDDASSDGSVTEIKKVVACFPERADRVHIIHHDCNKGLPTARNTGIAASTGEYIFHCDGDDFVEPDMLESMLVKAQEEDADFVWCDWYLSFGESERLMRQPDYKTPKDALYGMLRGAMKYNVWNKLVKKSLYDGIVFPDGNAMGEDMTMIRVVTRAQKVAYCPGAFYHYRRTNTGALTQNYSEERLLELQENSQTTIDFLQENIDSTDVKKEISFFCLNIKLPFLFTGKCGDLKRWKEWYPEANVFIMKNPVLPLRTRVLQWCAAHGLGIVNIIYTRLFFCFIYGKIYK